MGRLRLVQNHPATFLLLAAGVILRLVDLGAPPDNVHQWRQTQTLMYQQSYAHGAGWLTPAITWYGPMPRVGVLEFPLYSILSQLLTSLISDPVIAGRVLSVISGVLSIGVFFLICRRLAHPRPELASALFSISPTAIVLSHNTQPESLMLLTGLAGFYAVVRALQTQGNPLLLLVGTAGLSLAASIKPTMLMALAPPIAYLGLRGTWAGISRRRAVITAGLPLFVSGVCLVIWSLWTRSVVEPDWYALNTGADWLWGPIGLRFQPSYWGHVLEYLLFLTLPGAIALVLLIPGARRSVQPVWWWWMGGAFASVLIFAALNDQHFYYQLPLVAPLAALVAQALPGSPQRLVLRLLTWALPLVASVAVVVHLYAQDPIYKRAGAALAAASRPGDPVLVVTAGSQPPWFPDVLYYADRPGWNITASATPDEIDATAPAACTGTLVYDAPTPLAVPDGWHPIAAEDDYALIRRDRCRDR